MVLDAPAQPSSKARRRMRAGLAAVALVALALVTLVLVVRDRGTVEWERRQAERNYGEEVAQAAAGVGLPYEYFMALIVLECSGQRPSGTRFEPAVYQRLVDVRDGGPPLEGIEPEVLADASDDALRNLATSWGPFQLMGYKVIGLDSHVRDIRGAEAVDYGVRWIEQDYGPLLRVDRFRDAFHWHNAGSVHPDGAPQTHSPTYVSRGLGHMDWFAARAR